MCIRDRITGGSAGIGKAAAIRLAGAGARVVITARTQEKLDETCAEITALGGQAFAYVCDGADLESVDRVMQQIEFDHGGVDILINNAGRSIRRPVSPSPSASSMRANRCPCHLHWPKCCASQR